MRIQQLIDQYNLLPHPEGGYFAETWRTSQIVDTPNGIRSAGTAIYFLLTAGNFSAFHRIGSDETWHFYEGDPVTVHVITPNGDYRQILLGPSGRDGSTYQATVPAGCWFASHCSGPLGYALVGCTVAPGFDFADFELANRAALTEQFPQYSEVIRRFTR